MKSKIKVIKISESKGGKLNIQKAFNVPIWKKLTITVPHIFDDNGILIHGAN